MKIIKCPSCKEYVHFEHSPGARQCWNCGSVTDFSRIRSFEDKLLLGADRILSLFPHPDFELSAFSQIGKVGLVVALPVAITMLLLCNSLDISVVRDVHLSFVSDQIPGAHILETLMGM